MSEPQANTLTAFNENNEAESVEDQRKWSVEDFEIQVPKKMTVNSSDSGETEDNDSIGRGVVGNVYIAREKESKLTVALKVMAKDKIKRLDLAEQVENEIEINSRLPAHPNIVRMYNYFSDEKRIYLILELVRGGDLYTALKLVKRMDEPRAFRYVRDTARALDFCHKQGITHRDVKLENLLIGASDEIKLIDFGWAKASLTGLKRYCGTMDYIAPEILEIHMTLPTTSSSLSSVSSDTEQIGEADCTRETYDYRVDIWALGVVAYELMAGNTPFYRRSWQETFRCILRGTYEFPAHFSDDAKNLVNQLLVKNPEKRAKLETFLTTRVGFE